MIRLKIILVALPILCLACAAENPPGNKKASASAYRVQGYVEGEFVYVASPLGGQLQSLEVQRGAQVDQGELLFSLDNIPEKAAREEAERHLAQARANLEDARKGKRPTEIESLEAQLRQARAALILSEKELARQGQTHSTGVSSRQELDRAAAVRDQDRQRVAQLEADLKTAGLGSRSDLILAAVALQQAQEAALSRAQWELAQKAQSAPVAGLVFDTFYRQGEWVPAGRPVVALLPPDNIKVRAFVEEPRLASIHYGDHVRVSVDGLKEQLTGTVSFISPRAEFTPPVIYSLESRSKLVYLVEVVFDPARAVQLHPGQPVDVLFGD